VNYRGSTTSPLAAIDTVVGVQQDSSGNVSIGCGTPSMVQYSVDGVSSVNVRNNDALANLNPSSELIREFKVTAYNNNAEFCQVSDVTIATKSGTNTLTGESLRVSAEGRARCDDLWIRDEGAQELQHLRRQSWGSVQDRGRPHILLRRCRPRAIVVARHCPSSCRSRPPRCAPANCYGGTSSSARPRTPASRWYTRVRSADR